MWSLDGELELMVSSMIQKYYFTLKLLKGVLGLGLASSGDSVYEVFLLENYKT